MHRTHTIIFILILGIAAAFRFTGLNWDSGTHLHPDERFLTMVAADLAWPTDLAHYFDTSLSPLNPHNRGYNFYVYGTWPIIAVKLVAQTFNADTYDLLPRIGRTMAALADMVTVVFVFLIAKSITRNTTTALVAMFFYAISVLPIQLSHFFTVDTFSTLWLTIALWFIVKKKSAAVLGVAVGLAISAKISSVLILPIVFFGITKKRSLLWFGLALLVTIRIMYPYLFDGWHLNNLLLDNWKQLKAFDGVDTNFPPALQWIGVPFWQPMWDLIVWGLGVPLGILALLSMLVRPNRTLASWVLLVVLYQSFQFAKPLRYMAPIYPALAVLAAIFLSRFRINKLFYLFIGFLIVWPMAFITIYTRPHTRVSASGWIYANIPAGSTLAWEHWDDPLPLPLQNNHIGVFKTIQLPMYDPDTALKWLGVTDQLEKSDYIVLSSNRVYGGIEHAKKRYPPTNRYYALLFSEKLGFKKIAEFTSRPTLFGFQFVDDDAEESFTVYDHPKVLVFKNTHALSADELYRLIYER